MNQSLSDFELHTFNDINLFQKYEICRQQSKCYLLHPPPQLPIFPKLILPEPLSSSSTIFRQRSDSFLIIFGIFIIGIFICLLLFLFNIKFQFYHKLRQRYHRTKATNTSNKLSSFSNIMPISYNSLTPLTITTNQSPSSLLTNKSNLIVQQYLNSIDHNHSINIYEEIGSTSDHPHYSYSFPYYHTYELSTSKIICQNCLLKTLYQKQQQQCLCHHFFCTD